MKFLSLVTNSGILPLSFKQLDDLMNASVLFAFRLLHSRFVCLDLAEMNVKIDLRVSPGRHLLFVRRHLKASVIREQDAFISLALSGC